MNPRVIPALVFMLIVVMAVMFVMRLGLSEPPKPVTLAELDAGPGRVVKLTVEPNSQQTLSLHYQVSDGGHVQVDHAFFGTLPRTSPPPAFVIHQVPGSDLVGIAQASVPDRIIILHDFASNESWPMRKVTYKDSDAEHLYPYYEEQEPIEQRGDALFARLLEALPDEKLELLRTMGTRPLTVPVAQAEDQQH